LTTGKRITSSLAWEADLLELSIMNHGVRFTEEVRTLLAQFEQDTRAEVNLRVLEWRDAWADLVRVALYGDGPQVSEIGNTWLSEFVSMNAVRPFVGMELSRLGGAQQFLPSAWQSVTPVGATNKAVMTWAMPWLADMRLIHYRQDLFDQAGIDVNTAFQTPQALLQTCAQLQAAGIANPIVVPSCQSRMTLHNLAGWVWGTNGDFTSPDGKKVLFVSAQAKAGIHAYFDLARYMPPDMRNLDEYQSDEAYWSGQAAMTISGPWLHLSPDAPPEIAANTRQALPPGKPYIGGSHLVIWKHTRHVEPALTLIRHLNTSEAQSRLVQTSGLFPTRPEVLTHEPLQSDPFYQMAGEGLKTGRAFPTFSLWGLVENKLAEAFTAIWTAILLVPDADIHAIVDEHLNDAAQRLNSTLAYY
jgi:ABC-type glycerol-3-phosphate transport system substrate-binding protein